jgi:hypothetical protein
VQRIARVIGREQALRLIASVPRRRTRDRRYPNATREDLSFYVPKRLRPQHMLLRVLGERDAAKLVSIFGGEIIKPGNCRHLAQAHTTEAICKAIIEGVPHVQIAALFGVTARTVKNHAQRIAKLDVAFIAMLRGDHV